MFSGNDVNSAKEKLTRIFSNYDSKIGEINNEVWSGDSKNNFVQQTSNFENEFKSQLLLQLDYLNHQSCLCLISINRFQRICPFLERHVYPL